MKMWLVTALSALLGVAGCSLTPASGSTLGTNARDLTGPFVLTPHQFRTALYRLLEAVKSDPEAVARAILAGEVEEEDPSATESDISGVDGVLKVQDLRWPQLGIATSKSVTDDAKLLRPTLDGKHVQTEKQLLPLPHLPSADSFSGILSRRERAVSGGKKKGVLYLPINQPRPDPCSAATKGSKLLQALPLVLLSSLLSVADAVGNVMNNINNNNRRNNNNNNNNINSDNTNLDANVINANQINLVPFMGRALRMARTVMSAVGQAGLGMYHAIFPPSDNEANNTAVPHDVEELQVQDGAETQADGDHQASLHTPSNSHQDH